MPSGFFQKKELLDTIYAVYSRWVGHFPLVCKKGCASCCTQSVTMTSLEGAVILNFVKSRESEKWLYEKLARATTWQDRPKITTNQFAGACLKQKEIAAQDLESWDFAPCIFLENNLCTIYEARPFGCRCFGSLVTCVTGSAAEVAPIHLAVTTVFAQIIEHADSDGGSWGRMSDMLHYLAGSQGTSSTRILQSHPLPGFLLDTHELYVVKHLLQMLYEESGGHRTFSDLIDNFISI